MPEDGGTLIANWDRPAAPREQSAHFLVVVAGLDVGRRVEVSQAALVIGRDAQNELPFADPQVSKRHCSVRLREDDQVEVEDLGSTNGTFVNDRRLEGPAVLPVEGLLEVGSIVLKHEFRSREEVERAAELTLDLARARSYVEALLPRPWSEGPVRTQWRYEPSAMLGGDAFGYHAVDDDHTAIYLLDVCGHGAGAAMMSVSVMNVIRQATLPDTDFRQPAAVIAALNNAFQMDNHSGLYFSIWYGVYCNRTRTLSYASAGHPPALLRRRGEDGVRKLHSRNLPVGMVRDWTFRADETEIGADETLYLFSDGVYEIVDRHGREWALDDFLAVVMEPQVEDEAGRLQRSVYEAAGTQAFDDDFSVLVVRFPGA
jgi:serine phosphatase RsbU (regulator of sigma subunit)